MYQANAIEQNCRRNPLPKSGRRSDATSSKNVMALLLNEEHAHKTEDSDSKIVKFVVVERQERAQAHKAELTSFEELMLPVFARLNFIAELFAPL